MVILEARNIDVSYYGDINVLEGVSLKVQKSGVTAVIGPNGAGKSTLLKTLCGLLKPKKGEIYLNGRDITDLKTFQLLRSGVAFVPQSSSVFPDLTVRENLELGAWILRHDTQRLRRAFEEVYSHFPVLKEKGNSKAGTLSGGQRRILELGRALLTNPHVLLLDEITAMVAPKVANEIYQIIEDFSQKGFTIVMVDQNVRQAIEIAHYIYVLELGKNKAEGTREIFQGQLKELVKDWLH